MSFRQAFFFLSFLSSVFFFVKSFSLFPLTEIARNGKIPETKEKKVRPGESEKKKKEVEKIQIKFGEIKRWKLETLN